jgi:hypothetical protein
MAIICYQRVIAGKKARTNFQNKFVIYHRIVSFLKVSRYSFIIFDSQHGCLSWRPQIIPSAMKSLGRSVAKVNLIKICQTISLPSPPQVESEAKQGESNHWQRDVAGKEI